MQPQVMQKLDWPLLLSQLASYTQTAQGREDILKLEPNLERSQILQRWEEVLPLRDLLREGYGAPIGDIQPMGKIFRAIELGQVLIGEDLRAIFTLLLATQQVKTFANDFAQKCTTLATFTAPMQPLTKLAESIRRAIGEDGEVLDEASDELKHLRRSKVAVRKKIEQKITQILTDQELETYLQDKFYTIRADRYVVPIRLDGRGRVKGSIQDTSASGQTLFIEPEAIAPMNEQLREIELSEKLEVLRILRQLSAHSASELDALTQNYQCLIDLDSLTAQATLAHHLGASTVVLADEPTIELKAARHPLVRDPAGGAAVSNDIFVEADRTTLIISGPNAGGKTVVLKTVALLQVMAKTGLLLPADPDSRFFLFDKVFLELGDTQSLTANLSTFSGHLQGLLPIVQHASENDLVLLDELAVGTEPNTGAAIAQAILEHLADRKTKTLVTTHFDNLKVIATEDKRFRNGSMEFSLADLKATYKLILDVPGQSYGLELAEQLGLPEPLLLRAKQLRGHTATALDDAVAELMHARDEARGQRRKYERLQQELATAKANFEQAKVQVQKTRETSAAKIEQKYEAEFDELKQQVTEAIAELKETNKRLSKGEQPLGPDEHRQHYLQAKGTAEEKLGAFRDAIAELASHQPNAELPGKAVEVDQLKVGDRVFIIPLAEVGDVVKINPQSNDPVEVSAGAIKLRLPTNKLRLVTASDKIPSTPPKHATRTRERPSPQRQPKASFVLPTPRNTLDLRGKDVIDGVELTWSFIDKALLRGEAAIIILHGHGTDRLKQGLRHALANECPYKIQFRAGTAEEGGDAVTVILLE